jgi:hypothetical protein
MPNMPSISITLLWGTADGFVGIIGVCISAQEQGGHDGYVMAVLKYALTLMAMVVTRAWLKAAAWLCRCQLDEVQVNDTAMVVLL